MIRTIIFILLFKYNACENINKFFEKVNEDLTKFNAIAAEIAWNRRETAAVEVVGETEYQLQNILWHQNVCKKIATLHHNHLLNKTQKRQAYLLCRGPKYTYYEARDFTNIYNKVQKIYIEAKICIPNTEKGSHSILSVEEGIWNYISTVKNFFNLEGDRIHIAVKLAANFDDNGICLEGAREFEKMMKFSRNENVLKWVWLSWREKLGSIGDSYAKLVTIENIAAKKNGYENIGESWRDETEVPNLRKVTHESYKEIQPLYELLHGVVRYHLRKEYGDIVPENGLIPAHLLGSLWPQNWESVANLIIPNIIDLDKRIKNLNWTVKYMVERTEDFYVSLGLPSMPDSFWRRSILTSFNESTNCFGAAADMYKDDDVRISYCSGTDFQDFRVLHHELGHIQYFVAYKNQPGLFRQANAMLHESIGDAVMYGVMTPQHLHRLRLINDAELYNTGHEDKKPENTKGFSETLHSDTFEFNYDDNNKEIDNNNEMNKVFRNQYVDKITNENQGTVGGANDDVYINNANVDDMIMLKQALNKLPQIPYSLLIEEYRWKYFEGTLNQELLNKEFWTMVEEFIGVAPPIERSEEYFDIGAELHEADNTPYIRYFFSSFLQHQIFENLCKASVFGRKHLKNILPASMPLNRCDIYGSKAAGKILKDLMSRGNSQHWQVILNETIGEDKISADALKRYYRPLQKILLRLIKKYNIPIGW